MKVRRDGSEKAKAGPESIKNANYLIIMTYKTFASKIYLGLINEAFWLGEWRPMDRQQPETPETFAALEDGMGKDGARPAIEKRYLLEPGSRTRPRKSNPPVA